MRGDPPGPGTPGANPLRLSRPEQYEALTDPVRCRFEERSVRHARASFPAEAARLGVATFLGKVGVWAAAAHGVAFYPDFRKALADQPVVAVPVAAAALTDPDLDGKARRPPDLTTLCLARESAALR